MVGKKEFLNRIKDQKSMFERGVYSLDDVIVGVVNACAEMSQKNTNQYGDYDVGGDIADILRKAIKYI